MSGSTVRQNLGRMAEVEIELTNLGAFLRTVRNGVVNRFGTSNMTRVWGF